MKKKIIAWMLLMALTLSLFIAGCGKSKPQSGEKTTASPETNGLAEVSTAEKSATEESTTEENTTEEATEAPTEAPTETPTEAPTEPEQPTEPYVSVYSLLMAEEITPKKSGYEELDNLIDNLFAQILTDDMNKYTKVWTCYLYLVDNITYSRGMDANTGGYSASPADTTPKEVLWATDLLNSGQGCCYNYSAAFYFMMKALGYDAHLVSGNVPAYGGGETPHCWLYVNLGGEPYTFDPDLDMNFHSRGENDTKDLWFGRKLADVSYFYRAVTNHEI